MIDPMDPTKFPATMTREQLEWWAIFGVCVANKPADITRDKVNAMLADMDDGTNAASPMRVLASKLHRLHFYLKRHRIGQYGRVASALRGLVDLWYYCYNDLRDATIEDFEEIKGIGPKTARMIVLYSKPGIRAVPLDTHILKYLRELGVKDVPKSTPAAGNNYRRLEAAFIAEADRQGLTPRQLDAQVWESYAKGKKNGNAKSNAA